MFQRCASSLNLAVNRHYGRSACNPLRIDVRDPSLAKRIEDDINGVVVHGLLQDFRWLLASATIATVVGAILIPTFQRVFCRAVLHFQVHRFVPRLLLRVLFKGGLSQLKDVARVPAAANLSQMRLGRGISPGVIALNVVAVALWTTGVFASLYAGYLSPELRVTSSQLSSVINGAATIMMFVLVDPHMSAMTDDVIEGKTSDGHFRRAIVWLVASRFAGTLLAQAILVPAAMAIALVASKI